jgi:putative OPT family oligopeptide transporter
MAFILSAVLSVVLTASNTYLGLKAGLTVSSSIPAAVISMLVLKGIFRKGTIYENNVVQTFVSTGGSLASGVIFTIPALVIMGQWKTFDYWMVTWIAMLGGVMGVLMMIPLRKTLIVEHKDLVYPEGVAIAEVLKVGDKGIRSGIWLIIGICVGMLYKFFTSFIVLFKDVMMVGIKVWKTAFIAGAEASAALAGIGFIIGPRISTFVIIGAAIGWLIVLPIYILFAGVDIPVDNILSLASTCKIKIRFVGMGTMLVAGFWTIISIKKSIKDALIFASEGLFKKGKIQKAIKRTEVDLPHIYLYGGILLILIGLFLLYTFKTNSMSIGTLSSIAVLICAFFFVAVSSYVVGLVGTSSNPTSGMILTSLIFTCLALYVFKITGTAGIIAAICIGGTIGVAASVAGDMSQDLKCGVIIGATPYKLQIAEICGAILPAFIIAPILNLLHKGYVMGSENLPAPQAGLMKMVVDGILGQGHMDYVLIGVGILIGIAIVLMKLPAMPVAVGIYLPFATSCTIFIGGMIHLIVKTVLSVKNTAGKVQSSIHNGVLFSSGLIAGEALVGIAIAGAVVSGMEKTTLISSTPLTILSFVVLLTFIIFACLKSSKGG